MTGGGHAAASPARPLGGLFVGHEPQPEEPALLDSLQGLFDKVAPQVILWVVQHIAKLAWRHLPRLWSRATMLEEFKRMSRARSDN
jgi:hypothetical protein